MVNWRNSLLCVALAACCKKSHTMSVILSLFHSNREWHKLMTANSTTTAYFNHSLQYQCCFNCYHSSLQPIQMLLPKSQLPIRAKQVYSYEVKTLINLLDLIQYYDWSKHSGMLNPTWVGSLDLVRPKCTKPSVETAKPQLWYDIWSRPLKTGKYHTQAASEHWKDQNVQSS